MEELLTELNDILEVEGLKPDSDLADLPEFDSLAVLSIIAMVDSKYSVTLSGAQIRNARTPEGLLAAIRTTA